MLPALVTFRKEGVDWNCRLDHGWTWRCVTFRKEGVDWNTKKMAGCAHIKVTFRKEGVDWNIKVKLSMQNVESVTFRKEGVDWNTAILSFVFAVKCHLPQGRCGLKSRTALSESWSYQSPSARKVWIEIQSLYNAWLVIFRHLPQGRCGLKYFVAIRCALLASHLPQGRCGLKSCACLSNLPWTSVTFRKEGVDWNFYSSVEYTIRQTSPSAKKVWIEIRYSSPHRHPASVTFCKEGVDWNTANV